MWRKGELAKEVLLTIIAGVTITACIALPGLPVALQPILKALAKKHHTTPQNFRKTLFYLKKKRLIEFSGNGDKEKIILSEKGKKRILEYKIDEMTLKRPGKWDGKWRLIIFDIPSRKKDAADALRKRFQALGLFQLQKSCYVWPFECEDEVDFIGEVFEVGSYINYIVAEKIGGGELLKKEFRVD